MVTKVVSFTPPGFEVLRLPDAAQEEADIVLNEGRSERGDCLEITFNNAHRIDFWNS